MTPHDKFVNVLFDARQLSALEHIKRTRHFSTSGDAVRFCVLEQAVTSGWMEEPIKPKPRKKITRKLKLPALTPERKT